MVLLRENMNNAKIVELCFVYFFFFLLIRCDLDPLHLHLVSTERMSLLSYPQDAVPTQV